MSPRAVRSPAYLAKHGTPQQPEDPERRNLLPKVRAFADWLVETFGPEPAWEKGCGL